MLIKIMNYCNKCRYYTKPLFSPPKCNRISNYNVVKKKDIPFNIEEAFKICKGYFFEQDKKIDSLKTNK